MTTTLQATTDPAPEENIVSRGIPDTAYGCHSWQLDAWDNQDHPRWMKFVVVRKQCGRFVEYDGYILPDDQCASAYVLGWFEGRQSVLDSDNIRTRGD